MSASRKRTKETERKKVEMVSSSSDEDSDVEKNFALLTERGRGGADGEGEGDLSDMEDMDEEEEESDGGEEQEAEEEEEEDGDDSKGSEDEDKDDDDDDEDEDEDEDDDAQSGDAGTSEMQTLENMKKELACMSFEDVMKLQNKLGTKVYNQIVYGSAKTTPTPSRSNKKRLNKNRPMEISAKKPAPFLRQVVQVKKPISRDPRFDDLSGEYKPEIFEKTYNFIEDIRQREKQIVQKKLKRMKGNGQRKEELQTLLKRMENQEQVRKSREQQREKELQLKRRQRELAESGHQPLFLKKSDKKKLQLAEKFNQLKKSGKLENFLSKKRKRNAMKDRRKLPRQQQHTNC